MLPPLSSGSRFHTVRVRNPTVVPAGDSRGMRSLSVSCTAPNVTTEDPIGVAVCDTCSRTSYAVNLVRVSVLSPSLARKLTVLRKVGLLLLCEHKSRSYSDILYYLCCSTLNHPLHWHTALQSQLKLSFSITLFPNHVNLFQHNPPILVLVFLYLFWPLGFP